MDSGIGIIKRKSAKDFTIAIYLMWKTLRTDNCGHLKRLPFPIEGDTFFIPV